MQVVRTVEELRKARAVLSGKVGFVPTMGALHLGHASLIDIAHQHNDHVIASIFVNPTQFAAHEDLDTYPRDEKRDLEVLRAKNTAIAYLPDLETIYPDGAHAVSLNMGDITTILEGVSRPHFFNGVALVVLKLFLHATPDSAIFGKKDYQQLCVIYKLVDNFSLPIEIFGAPIMRESDGLALSSRNVYLDQTQRAIAPNLYKTLQDIKHEISGNTGIRSALQKGKESLLAAGFTSIDYLELCDNHTLQPLQSPHKSARILAATQLGSVRLIDNISIG